jgi:hypothetical protein
MTWEDCKFKCPARAGLILDSFFKEIFIPFDRLNGELIFKFKSAANHKCPQLSLPS